MDWSSWLQVVWEQISFHHHLLAIYPIDLVQSPNTNGKHRADDGIKMGEAIGAETIDLECKVTKLVFCNPIMTMPRSSF